MLFPLFFVPIIYRILYTAILQIRNCFDMLRMKLLKNKILIYSWIVSFTQIILRFSYY